MRPKKLKYISIVVAVVCLSIMIMANMQKIALGAAFDYIEMLEVDYEGDRLTWDSKSGPMYCVQLSTGELQNCSSDNAQILEYSYEGNIVTVTVYSAELPQNMTYIIDLNKNAEEQEQVPMREQEPDRFIKNEFGECKMDFAQKVLEFDTISGPYYKLDLETGEIYYCSSDGAKVIAYEKKGNIITLTVYSDELPKNKTYVFDFDSGEIKGAQIEQKEDKISYCKADISKKVLEFDTECGPYYKINLETGEIYSCSSEGAKVIAYKKSGNTVTLTVYSDELPVKMSYTIDITETIDYIDTTAAERADRDFVEYYNVYTNNTIQFDSSEGPYYNINYKTKEILGCTSEGARIVKCEQQGDILTLTLYSDELPTDVTYTFDLTKNVSEYNENGNGNCVFSGSDQVEYFNILTYENSIEFDSEFGPYYKIDLATGAILDCTSDWLFPDQDKAKTIFYSVYGDNITITLYSAELPYEMTYVFNTSSHTCVCGVKDFDKDASEEEFNSIIAKIIAGGYEGNNVDKETADKIYEAYKAGKSIVTKIETSSMSTDRVDADTMKKVEDKLEEYGLETIQFIEISVVVYADGELLGKITQLDNSISFTLETTNEVQGKDGCFYVARVHDGEIEVLKTRDADGNLISFETDKFSTYALIYQGSSSDKAVDTVHDNKKEDSEDEATKNNSESDETIKDNSDTDETIKDNSDADETIKDNSGTNDLRNKGFNPLWIIIPVLVVICGGVVTVVLIRHKKSIKSE